MSWNALLLAAAMLAMANADCQHRRDYGYGSFVCVCNTDHCDPIPAVPSSAMVAPGVITAYQTTRAGDRLTRQPAIHFQRAAVPDTEAPFRIRIDRQRQYQTILGFGGSFTDAAGANIVTLPPTLQNRLLFDYYADDGIQYNMGRIPIGGSDFSVRPYTYDDNPVDESLNGFSLQPEDVRWKIPWLKLADEVSPHRPLWLASPWSSPAWMKTNNRINHGGFIRGLPGQKYYRLFADYLIRFLDEYRRHNVSIWALTMENEPVMGGLNFQWPWNSLAMYPWLQREFLLRDLGPALERRAAAAGDSSRVRVLVYDDNLSNMAPFVDTIMADPDAARYVDGFAFHWYENDAANRSELDRLYDEYGGRFLLSTEACEIWPNHPQHVYLGSWIPFNRYAGDIIADLNHNVAGWIDWNLALDTNGGPNWAGNLVDAPIIVNCTGGEYYRQPMFYAMAHFSKFFRNSSQRIHCQVEMDPGQRMLPVTAFYRPDDGGTVVVVLNPYPEPALIGIEDGLERSFEYLMPPESMVTFLWF